MRNISKITKHTPLLLLVLALLSCGTSSTDIQYKNLFELLKSVDIKTFRSIKIGEDGHKSWHAVSVLGDIKPHYHSRHSELVYVIEGTGKLTIADVTIDTKAGDLYYIPRYGVHSYSNTGANATLVLSIFSPPFDGEDRIFVSK